jgi:uncharacterized protein involved in outer membrane biogenesis
MQLLKKLVGLPFPRTPNYQVSGQLDLADHRVQFRDFKRRVGNSDLEGTIDVDPDKEPPEVPANLASRRVDLADLGGFIGSEPGRVDTTGQSATQRAQVAKAEASARLLPDTPISIPKLHWADIDLKYRGQQIEGRSVPLDHLDVAMDIVNGTVTLHPISFGVGKGRIKGNTTLTPQAQAAHAKADVDFQNVDVSCLLAATHLFEGAGAISGTAEIDATGKSLAQMLGNGNGGVRLGMAGDDLSAIMVDLSGLQFGNAVLSALGLPKRTPVECFIGAFALQQEVATIQAFVLDTKEGVVNGAGSVNLRDESVTLRLRTEAKHFTIGSLPTPINITGTPKNPGIMPGAELLARGGAAAGAVADDPVRHRRRPSLRQLTCAGEANVGRPAPAAAADPTDDALIGLSGAEGPLKGHFLLDGVGRPSQLSHSGACSTETARHALRTCRVRVPKETECRRRSPTRSTMGSSSASPIRRR